MHKLRMATLWKTSSEVRVVKMVKKKKKSRKSNQAQLSRLWKPSTARQSPILFEAILYAMLVFIMDLPSQERKHFGISSRLLNGSKEITSSQDDLSADSRHRWART